MMTPQAEAVSVSIDDVVERAFCEMNEALFTAARHASDVSVVRLHAAIEDAVHHVSLALATLTPIADATDLEHMIVHEAYVSVLQLLTVTARVADTEPGMAEHLAPGRTAARALLDAFEPYIGRSEAALRKVLVEPLTAATEAALDDTLDALDELAARRLS